MEIPPLIYPALHNISQSKHEAVPTGINRDLLSGSAQAINVMIVMHASNARNHCLGEYKVSDAGQQIPIGLQ